uniref:Uncharacterized protein n=1 Tax=Ascaris lumbricoides TaxID=6252 RepID=A0A0M3IIX5_ASCLU
MITLPLSIITHPLFGDSLCVSGSSSATYIHSGLLHHPLAGLQLGADITAKLITTAYLNQQTAKLKKKSSDDASMSPNSKRVHFDFDVLRIVYSVDEENDKPVCI